MNTTSIYATAIDIAEAFRSPGDNVRSWRCRQAEHRAALWLDQTLVIIKLELPISGHLAAALNAWRLARWAGAATLAEPLLFILHVGYGWVVIGVALLGLSLLDAGVPVASAIHALTAGLRCG